MNISSSISIWNNNFSVFGGGGGYIVDDYSPTAAYSVMKISSTATLSMRIRRSSDNAEQDIGFVGDDLDTASLETFCSGTDGFVASWYDQANTYTIAQSTGTLQPKIVASGVTIKHGGIPAVEVLNIQSSSLVNTGLRTQIFDTIIAVHKTTTQKTVNYISWDNNTNLGGVLWNGSTAGVNGIGVFDNTNFETLTGEDLNMHLGFLYHNGTNWNAAKDGGAVTSFTTVTGRFGSENVLNRGGQFNPSLTHEILFFPNDESANKAAIESNINGRYSIY